MSLGNRRHERRSCRSRNTDTNEETIMAFVGTIVMEDITLSFKMSSDGLQVTYTCIDTVTGENETVTRTTQQFFKALAIALHPAGWPDADKDYPEAEEAMGCIRWIP